jgi:16S rRNA processing protein RimM
MKQTNEDTVPEQNKTEWATIGKVVALFGVQGELKVLSLTDIPDRFAQLEAVYPAPAHVRRHIVSERPYKGDLIILKLEGIDDANAAESLRNVDLDIPLDELASLPPDVYYQHDIIGLLVKTMNGQEIGQIVGIMPTGGNDVYEVKGLHGEEILIPAIKEVVKQVDLRRHVMYIDPIKGLLDEKEAISDQEQDEEGEV